MYENVTAKCTKKGKNGNEYISNSDLLPELIKSKKQGKPTDEFAKMVILLATNIVKRLHYIDEEDRNDCIEYAIMDMLLYYDRFDETKGSNPFAYLTSIAGNGIKKGWRRLGKFDFPNSVMVHMDTGNIHSL